MIWIYLDYCFFSDSGPGKETPPGSETPPIVSPTEPVVVPVPGGGYGPGKR